MPPSSTRRRLAFRSITVATCCIASLGGIHAACTSTSSSDAESEVASTDEDEDEDETYQVVFENSNSALLSVWGRSSLDVWVVGTDDGQGPAVLHYDGAGWTRHIVPAQGDLWWVHGVGDSVWMSGAAGMLLHYDQTSQQFTTFSVPGGANETLYGVVAFSASDVWAVGGNVGASTGVIYHWDGSTWTRIPDLPGKAGEAALFKVWGRSSDDLWVVGLGSVALHRSAAGWTAVPTERRLLTVHGSANTVLATGGVVDGYVVDLSTGVSVDVSPAGAQQFNGIFVDPSGDAIAVGAEGSVWRRANGTWLPDLELPAIREAYHSVWVDERGGEWMAGGQITFEPFDRGILVHTGAFVASTLESRMHPAPARRARPFGP